MARILAIVPRSAWIFWILSSCCNEKTMNDGHGLVVRSWSTVRPRPMTMEGLKLHCQPLLLNTLAFAQPLIPVPPNRFRRDERFSRHALLSGKYAVCVFLVTRASTKYRREVLSSGSVQVVCVGCGSRIGPS